MAESRGVKPPARLAEPGLPEGRQKFAEMAAEVGHPTRARVPVETAEKVDFPVAEPGARGHQPRVPAALAELAARDG